MPRQTVPPHLRAQAPALSRRLELTLCALLNHVAAQFRALAPRTNTIWNHIARTRARVLAIFALLAAGKSPRIHPRTPRPAPRPVAQTQPTATPRRRALPLPRRHAWLARTADFQVRNCASQLRTLLDEPETQSLLATAPPGARIALARALRPLCRMLGVDLPPCFERAGPPPPPRPAKPRAPALPRRAPPRPAEPPFRPLPAYVRATVRAWKPRYG